MAGQHSPAKRLFIVEPVHIELVLVGHLLVRWEEPESRRPDTMMEQAERPSELRSRSRGVDICGPKWPEHGPKHGSTGNRNPPIRLCCNALRVWSG